MGCWSSGRLPGAQSRLSPEFKTMGEQWSEPISLHFRRESEYQKTEPISSCSEIFKSFGFRVLLFVFFFFSWKQL